MPIYEYRCGACEHGFEVLQKISDRPVRTCPECGARRVERLVSAAGFHFKGSGWYVTDYARKGNGGGSRDGGARDGGAKDGAGKSGGKSGGKSNGESSGESKTASGPSSKGGGKSAGRGAGAGD